MKKDKVSKFLKIYNLVMSNFWLLITTTLVGVLIGYFLNKAFPTEKNVWLIIISIIFFLIGVFNFFYKIIKESIKLQEQEKEKLNV